MKHLSLVSILVVFTAQTQVLDVDGDGMVGCPEAIAVAEQWKEQAKDAKEHPLKVEEEKTVGRRGK
ncbi:MAG: hypothetical protein GHCLOJNM_02098 [bacterium]|nr:hypothetical protein [bacterium]